MKYIKSTATTEENYLQKCKNNEMLELYKKLRKATYDTFENTRTAATAQYISWSINGGRQFANIYIQKTKIRILTIEPMRRCELGESVPDTYFWTLNYKTDIVSESDIEEARNIIFESYSKLAQQV